MSVARKTSFVVALRSSSWTSPHSTGRTRLVLQPVRAANESKVHQRDLRLSSCSRCCPHPSGQARVFSKTKQEVLGWWGGKENSPAAEARSISAVCASRLACCGTAGKILLRLASGAPRLAGEGAHGNLSMISCRLRSGSSSDISLPARWRVGKKPSDSFARSPGVSRTPGGGG